MRVLQSLDREAIEKRAQAAYDSCHPDDSFADLKRRAPFSREDRCLLRDWLAAAERSVPEAS